MWLPFQPFIADAGILEVREGEDVPVALTTTVHVAPNQGKRMPLRRA